MKLRIAGLIDDSVVDGDGYRLAVFVQGCPHHCPGCHNPTTWHFGGGREIDTDEIITRWRENPLLSGVTFSGGEPFCQAGALAALAEAAHADGLDVWAYSGYTLEELQEKHQAAIDKLLGAVDVLVDGEYREEERDLTLRFRGSRNQRVIDMAATRQGGGIVLRYDD